MIVTRERFPNICYFRARSTAHFHNFSHFITFMRSVLVLPLPDFPPSRYEQGLEDYEEAAQRVEQEQLQEQKVSRQQQLSGLARPFMTLFSVLGNALSSGRSMQVATGPDPSWLFRGILGGTGRKGDDGQVGKSTSSDDDAADNQNGNEYFR